MKTFSNKLKALATLMLALFSLGTISLSAQGFSPQTNARLQ
jgi:hypothetical protein